MTKNEMLDNIEIILPQLQQYITFKEATLNESQRNILLTVGREIIPNRTFNLACGSCGVELIQIIWGYYQREKNNRE
jgi:hypothetical protein